MAEIIGYKFDEMVFKSGNKSLIIKMEDPDKYLVATFLMSDIQGGDPSYAINEMDEVIKGKKEYGELHGNVCGLEIQKEKTRVYDNVADDGIGDWCEIDTQELRDLIIIWSNKLKEFRQKHPYG
ncbi:hypothetical protein [Oceanobacillus senegalensis]|uniref:hypothetical protein n=1 Tax=Oceanobacillus senegalensis TaxID=1936063 RepID=UPI001FE6E074|nr:hypothetical protein [Oceanobacillus senegalensis]